MRVTTSIIVPVLCLITVLMTAPLWAAEESAAELAKKTQNPVADLISVPLQNNFNLSAGPNDATIYVLNVQPVIPLKLTEDWNLITWTIMPIINQPSLFEGTTAPSGWGTSIPRSSCPRRSPASSSGGGTDVHPADGNRLAAGHEPVEHGAGGRGAEHARPLGFRRARQPAVVVRRLAQRGCERDADPAVRELQICRTLYLVRAPIITANWEASSGDTWTVPVGGGGKLFKLDKLPINTQLQAFYNVERPQFAADWQLRFQFQFLFPK